ncbi:uncharacterized protein LOC143299466 [Babylonia areolata]|uniref:uncharacterized protein LOC143299466 n=1 Tax=Babylonia areolata TaxID=304850 RepID=UPI003FD4DCAF
MGEPHSQGGDTVPSPSEDVDSGQDRQALSDNSQPVFDQQHSATGGHSDIPRDESTEQLTPQQEDAEQATPRHDDTESITPKHGGTEQETARHQGTEEETPRQQGTEQVTLRHQGTEQVPQRHAGPEKLAPIHPRHPERAADRETPNGGVDNSGGGGVGVGLSVTLLTLDGGLDPRPYSRQHFLPSPRTERDHVHDMADLKLIRDFQVRRKYGKRPTRPVRHSKSVIELGLSGRRYFTNGDNASNGGGGGGGGAASSALDSARSVKTSSFVGEELGRLQNGPNPASSAAKPGTEEESSVDSVAKDMQSPVPSFPPLSPGGPRAGVRSENSFYSSRHSGQSPPSLLTNHFGFSTIRPDTFSGMQRHRKMRLAADSDNEDLLKELEQHAKKQILACQNMGFTHRGSRAAESVLSLKHTVSPSAFHPSSFFTRHVPRGEEPRGASGSRSGTPAGGVQEGEGGERPPRRRVTPAGKLSMPRLVVPDRQEKTTRRTTLPTVSGSSLQVVLTQSTSK